MVLLDTHIWLWWLLGDGRLKSHEHDIFDELATQRKIAISWVTIWETEMLERKGRIRLLPDFTEWIGTASAPEVCSILPVDVDVVLAQRMLPETFHADPADRLIVATALLSGYALATYDQRIVDAGVCAIFSI
jgi:PIN domain nuclease of toxin-antitoxin system